MPVRELARMTAEVLVASPRFLTAPLYRHWHLRWGATNAEAAAAMPGDEIVPDASFTATRAITIAAPPEQVWPWIVQIGTGWAGFFSCDLFDNAARILRGPHGPRGRTAHQDRTQHPDRGWRPGAYDTWIVAVIDGWMVQW